MRASIVGCAALLACAQGGARLALPANFDDRRLDGAHARAVLAVLPFEGGAPSLRIADVVTTALVKSGRVELVERAKIERVLDEQRLRLTGAIDDASRAADVGKLLGAEAVVFGAVTNATQETTDKFAYDLVRTEVRIDARAVDTTTGRILLAESGAGVTEAKVIRSASGMLISGLKDPAEEYRKAAENAAAVVARRFANLFPLLGYVVAADGDRVVANVGSEGGVVPSDQFIAFRRGGQLIDPVTHEPLGNEQEIIDRLVVESAVARSCTLRRRYEGSGEIRAGDVIVWVEAR